MPDKLALTAERLESARRSADFDPAQLAEALKLHANELILRGRLVDARVELDEAAAIHHTRSQPYDEARCSQMSAALYRMGGKLAEAKQRARRALDLAEAKGPVAVSAWTELGEIAMAEGRAAEAVTAFNAAIDAGMATPAANNFGPAHAALLRKRAIVRANMSAFDNALDDLRAAHDLLVESGDGAAATRTLIEQATALHYAGRSEESAQMIQQVIRLAEQTEDLSALSDIWMLVAAQAFERGDGAAAMSAAYTARDAALRAVVPQSDFGAAVAISRAANAMGNRPEAYTALATAWATLGDVLGKEAAQAWVEPVLSALRKEWGDDVFAAIRAQHDAQRRAVKGQDA